MTRTRKLALCGVCTAAVAMLFAAGILSKLVARRVADAAVQSLLDRGSLSRLQTVLMRSQFGPDSRVCWRVHYEDEPLGLGGVAIEVSLFGEILGANPPPLLHPYGTTDPPASVNP